MIIVTNKEGEEKIVKNTKYTIGKLTVWGNYNTDTQEAYLCIHLAGAPMSEMLYSATLLEDVEGEEYMSYTNGYGYSFMDVKNILDGKKLRKYFNL